MSQSTKFKVENLFPIFSASCDVSDILMRRILKKNINSLILYLDRDPLQESSRCHPC